MRTLLLIALLTACSEKRTEAPPSSGSASGTAGSVESPAAEPPAEHPPLEVTAHQLFDDYQANEVAADAKYLDMSLLVSGRIAKIGKDALGDPYLHLAVAGASDGVIASFDSATGLEQLRRGQRVTVRCRGVGFTLGSAGLSACVLAPTSADAALAAALEIATTAYDAWAADNPKRPCPRNAAELLAHAKTGAVDPWGQEYRVFCNPSAPRGKRLRVQSNGPDQKPDTDDDIKSWE